MAWIEWVAPHEAAGELRALYESQTAALGGPTDLTMIGSLYPPLSLVRSSLYSVVENCPSSFTPLERQAIAVAVASSLQTDYLLSGVEHKFLAEGGSTEAASRLRSGDFTEFSPKVRATGEYALQVANDPAGVEETDVQRCRAAGATDLDILDVNSLAAYYSYLASICLGLGLLDPIEFD